LFFYAFYFSGQKPKSGGQTDGHVIAAYQHGHTVTHDIDSTKLENKIDPLINIDFIYLFITLMITVSHFVIFIC